MIAEHQPFLLMDVDGVLNPYPTRPEGFSEYDFFPQDDEPVRLAEVHREWLHELAASFEMVWTSGWGDEANEHLCPHSGLAELPTIAFPPLPFEPAEKVPAVAAFVGDRAVAWVDDLLTPEARQWARERSYPTLLVDVDHEVGLTRDAVDALLAWRFGLGWSAPARFPHTRPASHLSPAPIALLWRGAKAARAASPTSVTCEQDASGRDQSTRRARRDL